MFPATWSQFFIHLYAWTRHFRSKNYLVTLPLFTSFCFFFSCLETVTPCSHVVSVMSVNKKNEKYSESQIQNSVWFSLLVRNKKSVLLSSRCLSFYQFFSVEERFCKIRVIVFIGVLRNMKVKCDLLRRKNKFDFFLCKKSRFIFSSTLVTVTCHAYMA